MVNFDFDGDGRLDPIEHATALTYYNEETEEMFLDDYADFILGENEDDVLDVAGEDR